MKIYTLNSDRSRYWILIILVYFHLILNAKTIHKVSFYNILGTNVLVRFIGYKSHSATRHSEQAIAWVDYLFFDVHSLHTWKIYSKKDDMELSFSIEGIFWSNHYYNHLGHDIRWSNSELYNLISCQPIGMRNSSLTVWR